MGCGCSQPPVNVLTGLLSELLKVQGCNLCSEAFVRCGKGAQVKANENNKCKTRFPTQMYPLVTALPGMTLQVRERSGVALLFLGKISTKRQY